MPPSVPLPGVRLALAVCAGLCGTLQAAGSDADAGILSGINHQLYTTNAVCSKNRCINPLFPAMEDISRLETTQKWKCIPRQKVMGSMTFCQDALTYDPALPVPGDEGGTIGSVVIKQERMAITMYTYHLQGMGIEFWDHQRPNGNSDPCIASVWRMVCYTYFPKGEALCQEGQETKYMRPCQSSCQNYVKQCGVQCCDESVKCVFSNTQHIGTSAAVTTSGYVPHDGPSDLCTGAAAGARVLPAALWAALLLAALRPASPARF